MGLLEDAKAKAEAEIERAQAEADEATVRLHFAGNPPRLRNESSQHANTLTDSEYKAVQYLASGKSIPKKMLTQDRADNVILKDGILGTAEAVARVL